MDTFIHNSAIIDEHVRIGNGTKIWHFTHVSKGVSLGENCNIGQNVFIGENVVIGNGVKIQNNVSVYAGVVLEDNVFIGPSVVFTNVLNPRALINQKANFEPTIVRQGATIGANATLICGHEIGIFALIGAGSVITKNIGNYELWYGNPAQIKGWVTKQGKKISFIKNQYFDTETDENYSLEQGVVKCWR